MDSSKHKYLSAYNDSRTGIFIVKTAEKLPDPRSLIGPKLSDEPYTQSRLRPLNTQTLRQISMPVHPRFILVNLLRIFCIFSALPVVGCIEDAPEFCARNPHQCDISIRPVNRDTDGDGFHDAIDCQPNNPHAFPGARWSQALDARCPDMNGLDFNCDGTIDYPCSVKDPLRRDTDGDGYEDKIDCVPNNPHAYPNAHWTVELEASCPGIDGIDFDCDGEADYRCPIIEQNKKDTDGDGFTDDIDCEPENPWAFPGARWTAELEAACPEINGTDFDCDGIADSHCPIIDVDHQDMDGDGYVAGEDCDDDNPLIHPGAGHMEGSAGHLILLELCRHLGPLDVNCDGSADLYCDPIEVTDSDGDGFADQEDCQPNEPAIYPGAPLSDDTARLCESLGLESIDVNCDGMIDMSCHIVHVVDSDGDGFNDEEDCRPHEPAIYPGAPLTPTTFQLCEILVVESIDVNCDGLADIVCEDHIDSDGDGSPDHIDCSPDEPLIYPNARYDANSPEAERLIENCEGPIDYNCDGVADLCLQNIDQDGDGVLSHLDCDDSNPDIGAADEDGQCPVPMQCQGGQCDHDGDGFPAAIDCDDTNENIYPGARSDPSILSVLTKCLEDGSVDVDCDGHADMVCDLASTRDRDGDGVTANKDCDDDDHNVGGPVDGEEC